MQQTKTSRRGLLSIALLIPLLALAQQVTPDEMRRAAEIRARAARGETVAKEEREFVQRVMARRNQEYAQAHPPRDFTGLTPLPDLGKGAYQGEQGGLYPGGRNTLPEAHLQAGLALARQIVPLDAEGHKAPDGKIVLLTIGMSNTTQESQAFLKLASSAQDLNPRLVLVDGAQGGQTAAITASPEANYWKVAGQRLAAAGVTPSQVQVVWLKQANAGPSRPFPAEVKQLQQDLAGTLHNLHDRYPNLKLAYLSSRIYGGYAVTPLNPEPHAYESGFAVKWLIASQVAGSPELNYDPARGAVRAPWIAWGPYLWADGTKGHQDGLRWLREDLGPDGTHPDIPGRMKVARLLMDFFSHHPTSRPWFLK